MSMNYVDEYAGDGVGTFVAWTIDTAEGDINQTGMMVLMSSTEEFDIAYATTFLPHLLGGTSRGLTSGNRDTQQHVFVMRAVDDPKRWHKIRTFDHRLVVRSFRSHR
jgi:hypothetical protein